MRTPTKRFSLEGGPASLDCDGRLRECAMRCERGGMPNHGHVSSTRARPGGSMELWTKRIVARSK